MRIAGGEAGGRTISVPASGEIRPTQESVREALFNIISGSIGGAKFLDLFSGSGAVGLEALSRGASSATFVEANRRHIMIIRKNIETLFGNSASRAIVVEADVYKWIERYSGEPFDIVFADPPYALGEEKGYSDMLSTLAKRGLLQIGGLFIAEMVSRQPIPDCDGWELYRDRRYGKTRLAIWRRTK